MELSNDNEIQEDQLEDVNAASQSFPDNTFDITLATAHSYLGNNLEVLRGRTLLDDGIYLDLPLWLPGSTWSTSKMVLFPGQTLPIMEHNPQSIEMLRKCILKDRTFGVACSRAVNCVGTTAEIYEYSENPDIEEVRVKAKGRQRFKILHLRNGSAGNTIVADVKILPEIELGSPYFNHRLVALDRLRITPTDEQGAKRRYNVERQDSMLSPWPAWVYHQFNPRRLSMKIHNYLKFVESRGSNIPNDPTELSFWVAQNLVITTKAMMLLLEMDCVIPRLQMEVKLLAKLTEKVYICKRCHVPIAKQTDVFPMNQEGLQSAYCNPHGMIHETLTLYRARSLILNEEPPSTECSWFPGYAWTIACCALCCSHKGWKFSATRSDLRPQIFWGLTRNSLMWGNRESKRTDESHDSDEFSDSENVSLVN